MSRKKALFVLLLLGIVGIGVSGCMVGVGPVFPMGPYGPRPAPFPVPGPRVIVIP